MIAQNPPFPVNIGIFKQNMLGIIFKSWPMDMWCQIQRGIVWKIQRFIKRIGMNAKSAQSAIGNRAVRDRMTPS